jgi:hypothetical protein
MLSILLRSVLKNGVFEVQCLRASTIFSGDFFNTILFKFLIKEFIETDGGKE